MGIFPSPEFCYLTGLPTQDVPSTWDAVEYTIDWKGKKLLFRFMRGHVNNTFVNQNLHILKGLIFNGRFRPEYSNPKTPILNNDELEKVIRNSNAPVIPNDKIENLLTYLHSLQAYEGSVIDFPDEVEDDLAAMLYFKNRQEMVFYLFTLQEQGLIEGIDASTMDGRELINIRLTFRGLSSVIELAESGSTSNLCFVAMSFADDLTETREIIKSAIVESGLKPVLIDEIQIHSEVTINDALIAEIKKCRLLVADFTQHKHGVYFEAGFALGLRRPVIYLCRREDFKNTHFDTNHYPHIIYNNPGELKTLLKNRIDAWIL